MLIQHADEGLQWFPSEQVIEAPHVHVEETATLRRRSTCVPGKKVHFFTIAVDRMFWRGQGPVLSPPLILPSHDHPYHLSVTALTYSCFLEKRDHHIL